MVASKAGEDFKISSETGKMAVKQKQQGHSRSDLMDGVMRHTVGRAALD